jgi:polygalacturonase
MSSRIVNVNDRGATPNDETDDTAAIQSAIDEIAGTGGTVLVPDGTYLVNVEAILTPSDAPGAPPDPYPPTPFSLSVKSDMTLKLSSGAILKVIPTRRQGYAVISIAGASNVTVIGGTIEGEREEHLGQAGEWGWGIRIGQRASHITISEVASKKMWGDGFYVQGATDVKFCSIIAEDNRRQGLSIIEADGLVVTNSVFKNTRGARPSSGIDLEPDLATQKITNVHIQNSEFLDNAGAGILIDGGKGSIAGVEITGNAFDANALPIKIKHAPALLPSICDNRQITSEEASGGLFAFANLIVWRRPRISLDSKECKSRLGSDLLAEGP